MMKRTVSFLLCLVMAFAFLPAAARSAGGTGTEKDPYLAATYEELRDLMKNAPTDGTVRHIRLDCDISSEDMQNDYALTLVHEDQKVVLDLAGHRITRESTVTMDSGVIRARAGVLTIHDSIGTGGVYAEGKLKAVVALTSSTVTGVDDGTIIINGGTYENAYSIGDAVYNEAARLYINGGTFKANRYALYAASGRTCVYGGKFYAQGDSTAVYLQPDQNIELYNLTAYGDLQSTDVRESVWDYIREDSEVFVNGTRQTRTEAYRIEGNTVEIRTDMAEMIWITAAAPAVGQEFPTSVDIPYGADYEIVEEEGHQLVVWMVDGQFANTPTFAASTAYTLRVYVKVTAPITLDFGAWVNGQPAQLQFVREEDGDLFYWVEYTFPPTIDPTIRRAEISVEVPVAGETAVAGRVDWTTEYDVSVGWSTTKDGSALNDFNGKTFLAGKTYYADIYLVAQEPYFFAVDVVVVVNGVEYTAVRTNGASDQTSIAVYDVPFTASDGLGSVIRLAGDNRFDTAIKVADQMKEALGVAQFDAVILANGYNFADALAGSYLSAMKQAPILLTWNGAEKYNYLNDSTIEYVKSNLKPGGTVYILGGTSAVPASIDKALSGFTIKRMDGANRFETNLMILEEAGIADGAEILVCTSTNFADSLSASAAGKPILLVFNESGKLYGKQPEFLAGLKNCTFTVIGGESAVSQKLADAVGKYGKVTRLAGANRVETSVLVAEKYFPEATSAVLAYAWDFPDGLCGGGLAYAMKAPLILTMTKYEAQAADYIQGQGIKSGVVLGGEKLISAASVDKIFGN